MFFCIATRLLGNGRSQIQAIVRLDQDVVDDRGVRSGVEQEPAHIPAIDEGTHPQVTAARLHDPKLWLDGAIEHHPDRISGFGERGSFLDSLQRHSA